MIKRTPHYTELSKTIPLVFFLITSIQGCELQCQNTGYCSPVSPQNSTTNPVDGTLTEICICPLGYAGLTCSEKTSSMLACDADAKGTVCENGGSCTHIHRRKKEEAWVCDCMVADSVSAFAGTMCRHPATKYCDSGNVSFCTNGGSCGINVVGNVEDLNLGGEECLCPKEFTGPHCEFLQTLYNKSQTKITAIQGTKMINSSSGTELPLMLCITFITAATILATYMFFMMRRKVKPASLARQGMEGVQFDTNFVNSREGHETIQDKYSLNNDEEWRDIVL